MDGTVISDAVNLASRLEAITKIYGAEVVVGEATKLAAPEFVYRELGYVIVKGKNEPVQVFEPLGLATDLDASIQSDLQQWHDALALMKLQKWDEVNVILGHLQRAHPDEKLYSLYLHRIAHYRAHLPTKDWDSVIIFDSSQA